MNHSINVRMRDQRFISGARKLGPFRELPVGARHMDGFFAYVPRALH